MSNPENSNVSPLAAIRDRERALAREIQAAEERATATVADARARADGIKEQAEREGLRDAETLYQEGLARAQEQAAAISRQGEADAGRQRESGLARIEQAANYIVTFVLPHPDTGSEPADA